MDKEKLPRQFALLQKCLNSFVQDCRLEASNCRLGQGRSQDFSKGGGGHTGSNNIVMAFSPRSIVGCLL